MSWRGKPLCQPLRVWRNVFLTPSLSNALPGSEADWEEGFTPPNTNLPYSLSMVSQDTLRDTVIGI